MLEQITTMVLAIALANAAVAIVMVPLSYIASGLVFDGLEKLGHVFKIEESRGNQVEG